MKNEKSTTMKRTRTALWGILMAAAVVFVACKSTRKSIVVVHTNDTHSQIECYVGKGDTLGGTLRRYEALKQLRKENPDLVLLDAGDFSQGSPYFNLFGGRAEIELMNRLGYEVSTLGNHEFDRGVSDLAERLKLAKFQIVCANYRFLNADLAEQVKPYTILKRGDVKIGVFGLTCNLDGIIATTVMDSLQYLDPVEISQNTINLLKSEGCDFIICLSHLGYFPEPGRPMCDSILAKQITGLDLLVSGHSHIVVDTVINGIKIVQTGEKGVRLGEVKLEK